jgi:hypothetical protein
MIEAFSSSNDFEPWMSKLNYSNWLYLFLFVSHGITSENTLEGGTKVGHHKNS